MTTESTRVQTLPPLQWNQHVSLLSQTSWSFTQVGVGPNDHLGFSLRLFQMQSSYSFLFELRVLLVEHFTPEGDKNQSTARSQVFLLL